MIVTTGFKPHPGLSPSLANYLKLGSGLLATTLRVTRLLLAGDSKVYILNRRRNYKPLSFSVSD